MDLTNIGTAECVNYSACLAIFLSPFLIKKWAMRPVAKSTVSVLGVLGTFIGIAYALGNFDVQNIQSSMPTLLAGLKSAFWTSIAGMLTSLAVTFIPKFYGFKHTEAQSAKADPAGTMIELLGRIDKSLSGEGESTLLTQVQKLRTTIVDKLDLLNDSFSEFAEQMVADSTQSVVNALTEVMKDFNAKINEQFGDNFKELNDAVGNMLIWQKEYSARIATNTKQFERTLKGVTECEASITVITNHALNFATCATSLQSIIKAMDQERNELKKGLDVFAATAVRAKEVFPIIHSELNKISTDLSNTVKSVVAQNQESSKQHSTQIQQCTAEFNQRTENMLRQMSDRIVLQVKVLDEQLGDELTKSVSTLGSHLTSLSGKMVEDYQGLTTKLSYILNTANS